MVRFERTDHVTEEEMVHFPGAFTKNYPHSRTRPGTAGQLYGGQPAASNQGGRRFRLLGLSFGLLCILQAFLNVSLRLAFAKSETVIANLTEERDQLQTSYNNMIKERDGLLKNRCVWCGQTQVTDCPAGWRKFGCSCYLLSTDKMTWQDSRQDCLSRGADLVTINSIEEQVFLITHFNQRMWIGLTDVDVEGQWRWMDGTLLSPSLIFWHSPQPDNHEEEDCAEIYLISDRQLNKWNDWKCKEMNNWVCEKDI